MIVRSILDLVFRVLARWRMPGLAARLLIVTSRTLPVTPTSRKAGSGRRRYRAVVMTRGLFLDDVEASLLGADDFDVICWPGFALKAFAAVILSSKLDHNYYLTDDPEIEASKTAYRTFLAKLWRSYDAMMSVDVVLSGNFAYFQERELATVLEAAGTPFIAIHKENVRPPRRVKEYWYRLYKERRGKFTGRRIYVYNEIERDLEISAGITSPEGIVVTGMPRLDRVHRWRREHAGATNGTARPKVLFFTFSPHDKLTAIHRKAAAGVSGNMEDMQGIWGTLSWGSFCEDSHRTVIELARARPDIDVVLKFKGQLRADAEIMEMINNTGKTLTDNIKIVRSGNPFEFITECRVAVGFNTTALLEAIASGKPVIVPRFAEALDPGMQDLIIDVGDAVQYASSPSELNEMICRYLDKPAAIPADLHPEASKILHYWAGNDDGHSGRRVLEALRNELK